MKFFSIVALFLATSWCGAVSAAEKYPDRPIRVVVPFSAGGSADVFARAVGQKMSEAWGQQVVIDNRAGSGGVIGTEIAATAPRDGYTLMMGNTANIAINAALYKKLKVDTVRDFAPIALVASAPYVMVAPVSLGVTNAKDFIALAKTKPGQLNYASLGSGSASHLTAELLQSMAGIKMTHVPYKTLGTVLTDLIAGQVQLFYLGMVSAQSQIKGGRLRAIAVTGPKRSPATPDLPTVAESGVPGYDVVAWYGLFAPTGTPRPIIMRVHAETNRILALPDMRERLSAEGAEVGSGTPEQFAAYIKTEMTKWAGVVKLSGAHAD
ncbi:MAG: tripartite tricarboxylate transporter substrate binding protein [Betaproteobacteria bacterium]|nr:tripartite tricarboxylate transporter substrate binding protein [Betaproteobacteria bacterium]